MERLSKSKIFVIFVLILLVPIFRASVFSFFDIPILQRYYAFQCHAFKGNIQEEKKISRSNKLLF